MSLRLLITNFAILFAWFVLTDQSHGQIRGQQFDDHLVAIQSCSYDELIDRIFSEDKGFSSTIRAIGLTQDIVSPVVEFRGVLFDPRVERLKTMLDELPKRQAAEKICETYRVRLQIFKKNWAEANKGGGRKSTSESERHALSACLFLITQYSPAKEFDRLFLEWYLWHRKHTSPSTDFAVIARPDPLLTLNLYLVAIQKSGKSLNQVADVLKEISTQTQIGEFLPPVPVILGMGKIIDGEPQPRNPSDGYYYIPGYGSAKVFGFGKGTNDDVPIKVIQEIRGALIPEVKAYDATIEAIEKWILDSINISD